MHASPGASAPRTRLCAAPSRVVKASPLAATGMRRLVPAPAFDLVEVGEQALAPCRQFADGRLPHDGHWIGQPYTGRSFSWARQDRRGKTRSQRAVAPRWRQRGLTAPSARDTRSVVSAALIVEG